MDVAPGARGKSLHALRLIEQLQVGFDLVGRGHDRLLDYFISYAPRDADGAAAAKLVVHTYD